MRNKLKRFLFNIRNKNIKLFKNVSFNKFTILEGNNVIHNNSNINGSRVGRYTYIAANCNLTRSYIGRYTCIGSNVRIAIGQHPIKGFVSIHPAFFSTKEQAGSTFVNENKFVEHKYVDDNNKYLIKIGSDVWIGDGVIILEGVTIADGSVIGAGAVVTKDTLPFSVNVGIPAKSIKYRFDEEQRKFLCSFKWWDKDILWIKSNYKFFENIDIFYEKYKVSHLNKEG